MRNSAELRQHASLTVASVQDPGDRTIRALGPLASGGAAVETVQVLGYTADKSRFRCKRIAADGSLTGDEFEARAFSLPRVTNEVGKQDLTFCYPNFAIGDPLPIWRQTLWTGLAWVDDWWAVAVFNFSCVQ